MKGPERYADSMRDAYQTYLQGRLGTPARSAAARLTTDAHDDHSLAGMRGPYLQALPIANWSDTEWRDFAREQQLHPNVKRAFHEEGFRRLYDFQERSVETVLNGDDTVITAATGRGKTEAWLIPLLDRIVRTKGDEDREDRTSTKALLMYPTKALAQDQFKRIVQILYRINRNLRQKEWVTIGLYDGDTPRHAFEDKAQGYLNRTFQHFGCPGANDELSKCRSCGQGVFVERSTDDFRLRPDKPRCETDEDHQVPLDFVRLTKNSVLDSGADIVLTNPDSLNYRLLNVNADTEHEAFVYEPQFLVFDEVHTYDGLLGSYTATLVKRLRRLRERRDCDPLQVIGSSATVENDVELFRQISGADDVSQVSEDPRELADDPPTNVPGELCSEVVDSEAIVSAARSSQSPPPQLGDWEQTIDDADSLDNDRLEERVQKDLFDRYTANDPSDPAVRIVQAMHSDLASSPRRPGQFVEDCADRFELTHAEAETLVDNFREVGQLAGLLESRNHVFSWPLDGFYTCSECRSVYRSPQEQCRNCGCGFVTRATYCKQCDDEYLVANACSRCDRLVPYVHADQEQGTDREAKECPYCLEAVDIEVPMHRVLFSPRLECESCEHTRTRRVTASCDQCGAPGVPTGDSEFTCRNPDCETEWTEDDTCAVCGGSDASLATIGSTATCRNCGETHDVGTGTVECDCGTPVTNTRLLPWVCSRSGCSATHFEASPSEQCSCGSTDFTKAGLYDVEQMHVCRECDSEVLPGGECSCGAGDFEEERQPYRRYKAMDPDRHVVSPLEVDSAVPCDHSLYSTVVGDAFDELLRSPTNLAVTTAQYLLRDLVGDEGFDDAKMLAFSDSHRDMKELDRSFTEPEVDTVLDQLVLVSIDLASAGIEPSSLSSEELRELAPGDQSPVQPVRSSTWCSVEEVAEVGRQLLERIEAELQRDDVHDAASLQLFETVVGTEYVEDPEAALEEALYERALRHEWEGRSPGDRSLEGDGLVDVRLDESIRSDLDQRERAVVADLVAAGNGVEQVSLTEGDRRRETALNRLLDEGVLRREDGRCTLAPSVVELCQLGDGDVTYDPHEDDYYSTLLRQFDRAGPGVPCPDRLRDRAELSNPRFAERAYTVTRSNVGILLSQLYYGSTPKMERREIEHRFREGAYPHFLSSGPTMELGVDIGSLDSLLLYGTPPNMNAYLQRVGRAGRSSHSSLVHSVSQRDPIDYYYFDEPTELITAEEQPVPLNEHNEQVLEVSLTWAVLDYLASAFVVPWSVSNNSISDGENVERYADSTPDRRDSAGKLTQVLSRPISQLKTDEGSPRLRPLGILIGDEREAIREHLTAVLGYAYCPDCHRHYDRERAGEECSEDGCQTDVRDAATEHETLIDEAIDRARDIYTDGDRLYADRLDDRIGTLEGRKSEIMTALEDATPEERPRLEREREQVDDRLESLRDHRSELSGMSYFDLLETAYTKYAFNLRSVTDSVDLEVVDESGDPTRIGDGRGGRSTRLALAELHPGAAYLHDRRPHVVAELHTDDKATADLRERIESSSESDEDETLVSDYVCRECRDTAQDPTVECGCGASAWQDRQFFAVDSVRATLDTQELPNGRSKAKRVYDQSGSRVQNTFSRRETAILDFDPHSAFDVVADDGSSIGTLEFGAYEILEYTEAFTAKYQNGGMDETATPFELCAEPDCPGILYEDGDDVRRCSVNQNHVPGPAGTDAAFARLGYDYGTEGVRFTPAEGGTDVAHTVGHGLRLALQKLAGVSIRDVAEYVDGSSVHVFDSVEGGAAISRQLVRETDGAYPNFRRAIEVMRTQFECDCADGCPRCVYQYGCAERNRPQTFALDDVQSVLGHDLSLRPK